MDATSGKGTGSNDAARFALSGNTGITLDGSLLNLLVDEPRHAARLILEAADKGIVDAQAMLGQILLDGRGIQADHTLALQWFRHAADQGHIDALNMVGRCLENGWGTQVDHTAAADCYLRVAQTGYEWGQYNYANMLAKGLGVRQNLHEAFRWYQRAAEQGHAKSMNLIGRYFEEGWIFPADPEQAKDWYRRSAEGGDFRGQCSHASVLTREGRIDEAVYWLRRSMQTATREFRHNIAEVLLLSSYPVLRDLGEEIIMRCSEQGNAEDWLIHARLLLHKNTPDNREQALDLLRRAAAVGLEAAAALLAQMDVKTEP